MFVKSVFASKSSIKFVDSTNGSGLWLPFSPVTRCFSLNVSIDAYHLKLFCLALFAYSVHVGSLLHVFAHACCIESDC